MLRAKNSGKDGNRVAGKPDRLTLKTRALNLGNPVTFERQEIMEHATRYYIVVKNPGTTYEQVYEKKHETAGKAYRRAGELADAYPDDYFDVMKVRQDGTRTTEF